LDLLGFKAKVEAADRDEVARGEILNALDIVRDSLCNNERIGMRFTHFSDCIIFSANRNQEGLHEILESIKLLTLNLLNYDFFVRGGLAVGGVHHDKDFVFGLAVNDAYELESKKAIYPMTLVSDGVLSDIRKYDSRFDEFLIKDEEGRYFVHYLKLFADYTPLPIYAGKIILDSPGRRIVDFVCHRLNTHNADSVLKKDIWFQKYWNNTVAVRGVFGRIEAGVTERDFGQSPFRAIRRIAG